uniref:Uncharacterized protein n=1 Tax=Anguilla anguilla TaxID=7936 RepID=A0A0E9UQJ5_ANGAN
MQIMLRSCTLDTRDNVAGETFNQNPFKLDT